MGPRSSRKSAAARDSSEGEANEYEGAARRCAQSGSKRRAERESRESRQSFQPFVRSHGRERSSGRSAREIGQKRKEGRNEISSVAEKGRRERIRDPKSPAARLSFSERMESASIREIGAGVSRLITRRARSVWHRQPPPPPLCEEARERRKERERKRKTRNGVESSVDTRERKTEGSARAERKGETARGSERETTLPSNPQSETTRRGDETLTEFSSDSRGERSGASERARERMREWEIACYKGQEGRGPDEGRAGGRERDWRESSAPPPRTTSPRRRSSYRLVPSRLDSHRRA